VEGVDVPFYLRSQDQPLFDAIMVSATPQPLIDQPAQAAFIAPLDNLMWDRRLVETLFGFEYRWEVYTPQAKRKYGYYVLPVLYGDRFIARVEPVLEKRTRNLVIKNWWWEHGVILNDLMFASLADCFERFCAYLTAKSIQIGDARLAPDEADKLVNLVIVHSK
jgi:uncharacterized protein YcaQ